VRVNWLAVIGLKLAIGLDRLTLLCVCVCVACVWTAEYLVNGISKTGLIQISVL